MISSIKDKENRLNYSQWTCGDYKETWDFNIDHIIRGSNNNPNVTYTKNESCNGDKSIVLSRTSNPASEMYLRLYYIVGEEDINKTATLNVKTKCLTGDTTLALYFRDTLNGSAITSTYVRFNSNNYSLTTLSKTIPSNCTIIDIMVIDQSNTQTLTTYVDDFNLIIQ